MTTPAVSTTRKYSGPVLLGFHAKGMAGSGGRYLQQQQQQHAAVINKLLVKLPHHHDVCGVSCPAVVCSSPSATLSYQGCTTQRCSARGIKCCL
jgi:hypothetical protein